MGYATCMQDTEHPAKLVDSMSDTTGIRGVFSHSKIFCNPALPVFSLSPTGLGLVGSRFDPAGFVRILRDMVRV